MREIFSLTKGIPGIILVTDLADVHEWIAHRHGRYVIKCQSGEKSFFVLAKGPEAGVKAEAE